MNIFSNRFHATIMVLLLGLFLPDFSLAFAGEFRYDSHGKRDPFLSPATQSVPEGRLSHGELKLEGIVVDKNGQSYAVVNGEIVREGQKFQGLLLKKITTQEVTFQKDDETFKIPLRQDDDLMKPYLSKDR